MRAVCGCRWEVAHVDDTAGVPAGGGDDAGRGRPGRVRSARRSPAVRDALGGGTGRPRAGARERLRRDRDGGVRDPRAARRRGLALHGRGRRPAIRRSVSRRRLRAHREHHEDLHRHRRPADGRRGDANARRRAGAVRARHPERRRDHRAAAAGDAVGDLRLHRRRAVRAGVHRRPDDGVEPRRHRRGHPAQRAALRARRSGGVLRLELRAARRDRRAARRCAAPRDRSRARRVAAGPAAHLLPDRDGDPDAASDALRPRAHRRTERSTPRPRRASSSS